MKKVVSDKKSQFVLAVSQIKSFRLRLTALFLIGVLLMQCVFFNPTVFTAKAQTNSPIQETPPVSEPPIPFQVSSFGENDSTESNSFASLTNYFSAPELPEGFENARTSSAFSQDISALGASVYSIFTTKVSASQPSGSVEFDFDGDDKADISRWRGTATDWQIKQSSNGNTTNLTFGNVSSTLAPGDFDGDGITDRAIFDAGTWTIKKSSNNQTQTISFGTSGDKPVTGDYDGDGKSDAAVFRASTNTWWILRSLDGNYTSTSFGAAGDIAAQGNYDGDSKTDIAIFRPSTGDWHISGSSAGYYTLHWGIASDIPTPADFDADGKTDAAVYRGSTGTWYVYKSSTNNGDYIVQTWGSYGDQPVPADYDGDSKADFAVFRPTTGVWHIIKSSDSSYDYQTLGMAGDVAVSSAYLKQIGGTVFGYDLAKQRLSPKNATGGTNLYSQNFGWGTGLVGLAGRAGMDAGFGISYNSLVWTKNSANNAIVFDVDNSNVSPGFRFGFPTIEPTYYNSQRKKFAYLMVTPSGGRAEFHQIGASDTYETNDSSYTQLKTIGASDPNTPIENISILVSGTDGSTMNYEWKAGAFRCSQIKDRNGNFVSINHDSQGVLRTVTDTLGRIITVNYDSQLYPTSITQTWKNNNGEGTDITHTYATFAYTSLEITTNFSNLAVIGPANGTNLKVLQKVTFPTESNGAGPNTTFTYNSWGQVKQINNYAADNHLLNETKINLPADATNPQTDCPRFTETQIKTENFNLANNQPQAIVINNSITQNQTYNIGGHSGTATKIEVSMTGNPYGAITRSYVGSSGWQEGLPIATEDLVMESTLTQKRWTWTEYTQDDVSKSYILNPRVTQSKLGDSVSTKRTEIDYRLLPNTTIAEYGLVSEVRLYDHGNNVLQKKSTTEYNLDSNYVSRRIIGLPSMVESWGLNQITNALEKTSKVTFNYDEDDMRSELQDISPIQHDSSAFSSDFSLGRGNLTSTTRHDVTGQTASVTTSAKYNTAGAAVEQTDAGNRKVQIIYEDSFNDGNNSRNTFAFPTKLIEVENTDTENNFSLVKYRFDTGANVWAKSPKPENNSSGKETTRLYDEIGRLSRETLVNTGAYTRYEYPTNNIQSQVWSTVIDTNNNGADANDEVYAESWTDGAGRVRKARTEHPNSTGGWTGSLTEYDILGRVTRSTVPTEINANYQPSGDDYRGMNGNDYIWLWTQQEYDWKSRVTRTIHADSNGTDGKDLLYNYEGCGCAGGQVTTIQGELVPRDDQSGNARRTQKVYQDILGRTKKTEIYNWDAATVYTTTTQKFNGRDQVLQTKQYAGTESPSNTHQTVSMSYDGHGRMKTRHYPIEGTTANPNAETSWIYNNDDSIQQVIDPRGAITNFSYNSRGLMNQITYSVPSPNPSNITTTPTVNFDYDALGNRTQMTDGTGTQTYAYDQLSRLTSETKTFSSLSGNSYAIGYTYNLGGGLKSITDPFNATVNYTNDKTGRLTSVAGTPFGQNTSGNYANNIQYRAFGGIKQIDYPMPEHTSEIKLEYDTRLRVSHSEATHTSSTSGFILKADFSYYADSRLAAKNDLLDDKWDRTMKYDFAGRLKFNQFGIGTTYNNQTKRVYEQTINYDAFSQMIWRNGVHWDNWIGFAGSYVNGRLQQSDLQFDASGNIVRKGDIATQTYQNTTFDAAGRRTIFFDSVKGRFGGILNQIQEHHEEYLFDGDGRPVVEKQGVRNYHMSNTNPPPMTIAVQGIQVWSTVLGSSLTTLSPTGAKIETKVFAGSALIATQNANGAAWTTADPVTGTVAKYGYVSQQATGYAENYEPLGQKINTDDPAEPPEPTYETRYGNADDPQWQCGLGKKFYGGFTGMPFSCQMKALLNAGDKLPWEDEVVTKISFTPFTDSRVKVPDGLSPKAIDQSSLGAKMMMKSALTSTSKKDKHIADDDINIGKFEVEVSTSYLEAISDSYNAEFNDDEKPNEAVENAITDATTLVGKDKCKNAIEDLLKKAYIEMLKEGKINYEEGKSFYDDFIRDNLSAKSVVDKVSEATKNYDPTNPNTSNGGSSHTSAETKFESGKPTITFYGGFFREIINDKPFISDGSNKTPSTYFGEKTSSLTRAQTVIHEGIHAIFGSSKDLKGFTDGFIGRIIKGKSKDLSREDGSKAISKFIKDNCN